MKLPRSRFLRALIYLAAVLLIVLAADLALVRYWRHIHVGYDTTRLTEPRNPDGSIDFLAAVDAYFGRGVTFDNNAAIPLLQILGPAAVPKTQAPDALTSRLGMPPLPPDGNYYVNFDDFKKSRPDLPTTAPTTSPSGLPEPENPPIKSAWRAKEHPLVAEWIAANQKSLDRLLVATRRPRFHIPFDVPPKPELMISLHLPHVVPTRDLAAAAASRATLRLAAGDVDGAHQDLLAVHRLGRLFTQQPTLVETLVGITIDGLACQAEQQAAVAGGLTAEQARAWSADLAALPPLDPPADRLDIGERSMFHDINQYFARHSASEAAPALAGIAGPPNNLDKTGALLYLTLVPVHYDQLMRDANAWYDRMVIALRKPTYPERAAALNSINDDISRLIGGQGFVTKLLSGEWLMSLFLPSVTRVHAKHTAAEMRLGLTRAALALSAYKSDIGRYPAALDALAPKYLEQIPPDLFTNQPLTYRPVPDGTSYLLYSRGPNMTDDGGKDEGPSTRPATPPDDIAVRASR
jgi:hypothetical protein